MLKKYLIFIIIIGVLINSSLVFAQEVPNNLDQAKEAGEIVKEIAIEESPNVLSKPGMIYRIFLKIFGIPIFLHY